MTSQTTSARSTAARSRPVPAALHDRHARRGRCTPSPAATSTRPATSDRALDHTSRSTPRPPARSRLTGPNGATNDTTPTYTITGGGSDVAGYQCKVDGGAFANVTSPYTTVALADGAHVVTCRAVDAAGNTGSESSKNITVDTVAPGAVTISGPSGATNDDTPTYTLTGAGTGEHYECKINGGAYATVTSPYTTAALGQGVNTVTCRVVDAAGNAGAESSKSVTVDSIGPAITIADGAPNWDGTHAFTLGSGEAGTTFKCKIDGGAYATVSANYVTGVLTNGSHTRDLLRHRRRRQLRRHRHQDLRSLQGPDHRHQGRRLPVGPRLHAVELHELAARLPRQRSLDHDPGQPERPDRQLPGRPLRRESTT